MSKVERFASDQTDAHRVRCKMKPAASHRSGAKSAAANFLADKKWFLFEHFLAICNRLTNSFKSLPTLSFSLLKHLSTRSPVVRPRVTALVNSAEYWGTAIRRIDEFAESKSNLLFESGRLIRHFQLDGCTRPKGSGALCLGYSGCSTHRVWLQSLSMVGDRSKETLLRWTEIRLFSNLIIPG